MEPHHAAKTLEIEHIIFYPKGRNGQKGQNYGIL